MYRVLFLYIAYLSSCSTDSMIVFQKDATITSNMSKMTEDTVTSGRSQTTEFVISTSVPDDRNQSNIGSNRPGSGRPGFDRSIIFKGLVSKKTYDDVARILGFAALPFSALAIIFNIFNITIFGRKDMHTPSQVYLVSLSVVELLFSVLSSISGVMAVVYGEESTHTFAYLWYASHVSGFVTNSVRRSAYFITLITTIERFVAVVFPLKFRNFQITRYRKAFSVAIITVSFILHIPYGLQDDIVGYQTPGTNETKFRMQRKEFFVTNDKYFGILKMFNTCVYVYIPLFTCILLDILTIVALKFHSRNRYVAQSSTNTESKMRRERQMTITLLASSFIFVFFSLPISISTLVSVFDTDYGIFQREHYVFFMMFRVGNISEIISNCTDFIFYFILSSKFRDKFLQIYCPFSACRKHRRQKSGRTSMISQRPTNVSVISSGDSGCDTTDTN